jgi:hypothetical protein
MHGKVKPHVVHWSGKLPDFVKHLCTWVKAGTVKMKTDRNYTAMHTHV